MNQTVDWGLWMNWQQDMAYSCLEMGLMEKWKRKCFYLEMNPVHAVSDVLEHAFVGHEKVSIFEASLTTRDS